MTEPSADKSEHGAKPIGLLRAIGHTLAVLFRLVLLVAVLSAAALFVPGPSGEEKTVVFARGTSTAAMAAQLANEHIIYAAPLFRIAAKVLAGGYLKAGEYALPAHASVQDIAQIMHDGKSVVRMFTVAEGLTSAEIVKSLQDDPALIGAVDTLPDEGSLLPETYRYDYGDSRLSLITRMKKSMADRLTEVWAARDEAIALRSPEQAVILASVVEKETGRPEERPRIAGVFYNRLRMNMRLQSDPTVIYAITKGREPLNRALTHDDLAFASPINTYVSDGLPPQPICNPGLAALQAVTHPEQNNFLYFVADGTGKHAFAADLATQDQNINHWHQLLEKAGTSNDRNRQ